MRKIAFGLLAGVLFGTFHATAADDAVPAPGWQAEWRAKRNQLIEKTPDLRYDPTSVVVQFDPVADQEVVKAVKKLANLTIEPIETWEILPGLEHLHVPGGNAEAVVAKLNGMPGVVYAELDYIVHTFVTPNDPSFGVLWGMNNTGQTVNGDPGIAGADINAPQAWDLFTGSASFVIADIDTGVNYNHPDLAANSWINPGEIAGNAVDDDGNGYVDDTRGWDFYSNDNNPIDDNGHGSHTSGTFGGVGNNGVGVAGVNWQCKIMALKFLGSTGSGSTTGAISAVNYLVAKGVKVSNNSWGGGGFSQALFDAINASRSIGHVFVAAAGNSGVNTDTSPSYPQGYALDNIISVAASDNNDARASFSNYGAASVDLAAPGVNIYSTYGSGYAYLDGTSMATPHVTGVVALVQARNPSWTYSQVRQRIFDTVRPVAAFSGITARGGVLDAFAAINDGAPVNNPPSVTISSPANGATFALGANISFAGSGSDPEDGNVTASLQWTSSINGSIGSGGSFSSSTLSAGSHVISATATDSGGRTGSSSVTITVSAPGPSNDACGGAIPLTDGVAASGSTANATNDGTATCGSSTTSPDMWFTYTTSGNTTVTIDTCGSGFDTVLSVYTGACGALTQIACNDDNGSAGPCPGGLTSYVTFTATPGATYRIRIAGYAGATGAFSVRAAGGNSTAPTVPAAPSGLSVTRVGSNSVLQWNDNSSNETLFRIQRQQKVGSTWQTAVSWTVGANSTSYPDPVGVGTWRWRIRSENSAGSSSYTGWVQQRVR